MAGAESEEHAPVEPTEFAPPARDTAPSSVATAQFVPSTTEIRPGGSFHVALHLSIHPGYRVGWLYAGDVGKPTVVKVSGPPGFEVGPVKFTGPSRFGLSGGLTSYGYKDRATAFAEVRAPRDLSTNDVYRFDVKATWIACERECVSEGTEAYFELSASTDAATGEFPSEIQAQLAHVPVDLVTLPEAKFDWRTASKLVVSAKGVSFAEFFPAEERLRATVSTGADALSLGFDSAVNQTKFVGVAKASVEGREVFVNLQPVD